jgi:hypothetical protein
MFIGVVTDILLKECFIPKLVWTMFSHEWNNILHQHVLKIILFLLEDKRGVKYIE